MPFNVVDIIVIAIVAAIVIAASIYIIRAKKKGVKCIGCPSGCNCGSGGESCGSCGGCSSNNV